jgi:hypothetical protein
LYRCDCDCILSISGSVFIFYSPNAGSPWTLLQQLVADDGSDGDIFGISVSFYDGMLAVGAIGRDDSLSNAGAVYLFANIGVGNSGSLQQKLLAADRAAGDNFGRSVSLYGDVLAVGAENDDTIIGGNFFEDTGGVG